MLRSANFVAIHLTDISAAENYYTNVMKFEMVSRTEKCLEYETGNFHLYVNADLNPGPPIPSFTVKNIERVKGCLVANGCTILREEGRSLRFSDPFGVVYNVAEEES